MQKGKVLVFLLVVVLVFGIVGCSSNNAGSLRDGNVNPNGLNPYSMDRDQLSNDMTRDNRLANNYNGENGYNGLNLNNSGYGMNQFRANSNDDAEKMANACERINGVNDCTVVIANGKAYCALDLEDEVQSTEARRVEQECNKKLRDFSNNYSINITSDEDMFGKLRDIGDGIKDGNPISKYQNDFGDFDNNFGKGLIQD